MRILWAMTKQVVTEIFRKKDFYVAFILMAVILMVAGQMAFYDEGRSVRYLREIGLALIFVFAVILVVPLTARQYSSEKNARTLQLLLAKPVSRMQFVVGKFLGSVVSGVACFLIFYAVFVALTAGKGGSFSYAAAVETAYLFCLGLTVLTAMTLALSFYLTPPANVSITLIVYFAMLTYGENLKNVFIPGPLAQTVLKVFYYLLPHFEFFDMRQRFIHDWGPIPPGLVVLLTLYALIYTVFFLGLGWLGLRDRRL